MYGIRLGRINRIEDEEYEEQYQWSDPCVLQRISSPLLEEGFRFPPFGKGFLAV